MSKLGTIIKKERNNLGLSLRDVESKIDISNAYLSQLENNKIKQPSPQILKKLADFFDISYSKLMNTAGYPIEQETSKSQLNFRTSHGLVNISQDEEEKLLEYLDFLRNRGGKS